MHVFVMKYALEVCANTRSSGYIVSLHEGSVVQHFKKKQPRGSQGLLYPFYDIADVGCDLE